MSLGVISSSAANTLAAVADKPTKVREDKTFLKIGGS